MIVTRLDKLEYAEVLKLIKAQANFGHYEVTLVKPKDYVGLQATLMRNKFKVTFPNPDEMTISWAAPSFEARDAHVIASEYQLRSANRSFINAIKIQRD